MKRTPILFCTIIFCNWFPYSFAMGVNTSSRLRKLGKGSQNNSSQEASTSSTKNSADAAKGSSGESSAPQKSKHTRVRFGPKPKPRRKKPLGSKYNAGKDPIWVPKYKYLIGVDLDQTAQLLTRARMEDLGATVKKIEDTYWITYSNRVCIGVVESKERPEYEYCQKCPWSNNSAKLRPKFNSAPEEYWHTKFEHDYKKNYVRMSPAFYVGKPIWTEKEPAYGTRILAKILVNPKPGKTVTFNTPYGPSLAPPPPKNKYGPPPIPSRKLGPPPPMLSSFNKSNASQFTTKNPLFELPEKLVANLFANQGLPLEAIAALKKIQISSGEDSSDEENLSGLRGFFENKDPWGLGWPNSETKGTEMKVFEVMLVGSDEDIPGGDELDLD